MKSIPQLFALFFASIAAASAQTATCTSTDGLCQTSITTAAARLLDGGLVKPVFRPQPHEEPEEPQHYGHTSHDGSSNGGMAQYTINVLGVGAVAFAAGVYLL